jgi:hypothetical protein
MFWPFHIGAALANLLFPVFVMVACGADPLAARGACAAVAHRLVRMLALTMHAATQGAAHGGCVGCATAIRCFPCC